MDRRLLPRSATVVAVVGILVVPALQPLPASAREARRIENLRLAGEVAPARGAFTVSEEDQGADLNGDGDRLDDVVHVTVPGGPVVNSRLATYTDGAGSITESQPGGPGFFFQVPERRQGDTDLNGDGDTDDTILHLYRPGHGFRNLRIAAGPFDGIPGLLSVREQGRDLNRDGDTDDNVFAVYDFDTGRVRNLRLAGSNATASGDGALLTVEESAQGSDLNRDGDMADDVVFRFDPAAGLTNLRLAGEDMAAPSMFMVHEAGQGADFNRDGDMSDRVLHYVDPVTGAVRNLRRAVTFGARPAGDHVVFAVPEAGQGPGGTDLNGDGDKLDAVMHVFVPPTTVINTRFVRSSAGRGVWRASEMEQGIDLNRDGDRRDSVFIAYDPGTRRVRNTRLAGGDWQEATGGYLLSVSELEQGRTDLNGDGDIGDHVMHFFDPATGARGNLRIAGFGGELANLFVADEAMQGRTDLNRDGDRVDLVLHHFRPRYTLGRALPPGFSRQADAGPGFLFEVSEAAQGNTDLNRDGDTTDTVVHALVEYPEHTVGLVDPATGIWRLRGTDGATAAFFFGNPADVPFMGDWDCDGVDTPGLFRQSDAFAYLRNSNTQGIADVRFFFGDPADVPIAGDFNGDGCDTLSIYRPSEQRFYIIGRLGRDEGGLGAADFSFGFGNPGDKPVVGDWDKDGIDEVGLHRESTGFFYYRNTLTTGVASARFYFGDPGDRFVAGDWGRVDGTDTPAVFRPSARTFFFRHTNTPGVADSRLVFGQPPWLPVGGAFGF